MAEGKLDKHGRPNENTPKEYLRSLPDLAASTTPAKPAAAATAAPADGAAGGGAEAMQEDVPAAAEAGGSEKKKKKKVGGAGWGGRAGGLGVDGRWAEDGVRQAAQQPHLPSPSSLGAAL